MAQRIHLIHSKHGGEANVLPEHVETWEAQGWQRCDEPKKAKKAADDKAEG